MDTNSILIIQQLVHVRATTLETRQIMVSFMIWVVTIQGCLTAGQNNAMERLLEQVKDLVT